MGGRWQADRGVAGLGEAVDLGELAVEDGEALLQQCLGDGGTAVDGLAQGGEVLGADIGFGQHHAEHGRDDAGGGDAEVADEIDDLACGEGPHRDDRGSGVEVLRGPPQAADVESGDADQRDVAGAPVDPVQPLARQRVADREEAAVGEHDALGQSGGAAGVELGDGGVGGDVHCRVGVGVGCLPDGEGLSELDDRVGGRGRHPLDDRPELLLQEEQSGPGVPQDVADLGRGQPPVDGDEHGAALGAAEEDLVVVLGLLAEVRDPVARRASGGLDGVGDAVALAMQLVVRHRAALEENRGRRGLLLCVEARGLDERLELRVMEPVHGHGGSPSSLAAGWGCGGRVRGR